MVSSGCYLSWKEMGPYATRRKAACDPHNRTRLESASRTGETRERARETGRGKEGSKKNKKTKKTVSPCMVLLHLKMQNLKILQKSVC